jgi:hypothetical protein
MNLFIKSGLFLEKKPAKKCHMLTGDLDKIGPKLEHTLQRSVRCLAQDTDISKSSEALATKLLKLSCTR